MAERLMCTGRVNDDVSLRWLGLALRTYNTSSIYVITEHGIKYQNTLVLRLQKVDGLRVCLASISVTAINDKIGKFTC